MHFFHLHIPINKAIMNIALITLVYFLGFFSESQISIETDFLNSGVGAPEFSLFVTVFILPFYNKKLQNKTIFF